MRRPTAISLIALAAAGLSAAVWWAARDRSPHLAVVDGTPVTEAAFRHWWDREPPAEVSGASRRRVLDELIGRAALVNRARELGVDRDPAVLAEIESLLIARLREVELGSKLGAVEVTEEELRAHYEAHASEYRTPGGMRVAVLWMDTKGREPLVEGYRPRLEAVREEAGDLPAEGGFGALAIRNSEHTASRYRGGDLGWIDVREGADAWRNTVVEIASGLREPGEVSAVTATDEGLFLVRLIGRREPAPRPFDEVRGGIAKKLLRDRRGAIEAEFLAGHGAGGSVEINQELLQSLTDLRPARSNLSFQSK